MQVQNSKNKTKLTLLAVIIFCVLHSIKVSASNDSINIDKNLLKTEVERIYNIRSKSLVTGQIDEMKECFDLSHRIGKYSLEHEIKRVKYLKDWAQQRNIEFKNIESTVRINKVFPEDNIIKMALEETYKFDYVYNDDPNLKLNSFGIGIRHKVNLIKKNSNWLIYSDMYTDCFEDALQAYKADDIKLSSAMLTLKETSLKTYNLSSTSNKHYDRQKAVAYADKYCGAAWGSGNDFKYNSKYDDFNGRGGDCTNFVSQVLGDIEAGGMKFDKKWYCSSPKYGKAQGSKAWSNADKLKDYLIESRRGRIIKAGTFSELTTSKPNMPQGAVSKLCLGDLICYEKGKDNIDHFAVVTGFDSKGYPLVNSHTTDRYHVPWDLGWGDKKIRFFLIHIN